MTGIIVKIEPWLLPLSSLRRRPRCGSRPAARRAPAPAPCRCGVGDVGPCTPSTTSARTVISSSCCAATGSAPRARSAAWRPAPAGPRRRCRCGRLIASSALELQRARPARRGHHVDQLGALAVLRRRSRPTACVCSVLRSELGVDAERARLVLVDLEPHGLGELVPVDVDVAHVGFGLNTCGPCRRRRGPAADRRPARGTSPDSRPAGRSAAAARGRAPPRSRWRTAGPARRRRARARSRSLVMTMTWPKFALESSGTVGR